jgi:AcrR family transcriptional regulator
MHVKTEPIGAVPVRRRKAEQSEVTRGALLAVACELFAEVGFARANTEEVVRRAGVTRGALYHHFRDKEDLFAAVFDYTLRALYEKVFRVIAAESDPWQRLIRGALAFLDGVADPAVRRIVILEARSVLSREDQFKISGRLGPAVLGMALKGAIDAGLIEPQPVEPLAFILGGAIDNAALLIAQSEDPRKGRKEVGAAFVRLLELLRKAPPAAQNRRRADGSRKRATFAKASSNGKTRTRSS